jgi:hypothetical protein
MKHILTLLLQLKDIFYANNEHDMTLRIYKREEKRQGSNCILLDGSIGIRRPRNWSFIMMKRSIYNGPLVLASQRSQNMSQRKTLRAGLGNGKCDGPEPKATAQGVCL